MVNFGLKGMDSIYSVEVVGVGHSNGEWHYLFNLYDGVRWYLTTTEFNHEEALDKYYDVDFSNDSYTFEKEEIFILLDRIRRKEGGSNKWYLFYKDEEDSLEYKEWFEPNEYVAEAHTENWEAFRLVCEFVLDYLKGSKQDGSLKEFSKKKFQMALAGVYIQKPVDDRIVNENDVIEFKGQIEPIFAVGIGEHYWISYLKGDEVVTTNIQTLEFGGIKALEVKDYGYAKAKTLELDSEGAYLLLREQEGDTKAKFTKMDSIAVSGRKDHEILYPIKQALQIKFREEFFN